MNKAILTRVEVERRQRRHKMVTGKEHRASATIIQMAELLEQTLPFLQSTSVSLYYDINILLSTFNATGGEG